MLSFRVIKGSLLFSVNFLSASSTLSLVLGVSFLHLHFPIPCPVKYHWLSASAAFPHTTLDMLVSLA